MQEKKSTLGHWLVGLGIPGLLIPNFVVGLFVAALGAGGAGKAPSAGELVLFFFQSILLVPFVVSVFPPLAIILVVPATMTVAGIFIILADRDARKAGSRRR